MDNETFGSVVRSVRIEQRLPFGRFVRSTGLSACDLSKMERGLMAAPKDERKLHAIYSALNIALGSEEERKMSELARRSQSEIVEKELTEKELVGKLPFFAGALTDEAMDELIAKVKEAHRAEPNREIDWS